MSIEISKFLRARFGSALAEKKVLWATVREARLANFGTTAWLIPMGDSDHDTDTIVTTAGEEQLDFTYSKDVTTFDNPPGFEGPGHVPVIQFDGVDEEADTPDVAALSTAGAFSIIVWVYMIDATTCIICAKWDETTGAELREYQVGFDSSDRPYIEIYDESANASVGRYDATAITEDAWQHLAFTFSGGTDAADAKIYLNGVQVDDTNVVDDAGFADAEDLATVFSVGYMEDTSGAKAEFFDGKMAGGDLGLMMVLAELTADQVSRDYQLGRAQLGV